MGDDQPTESFLRSGLPDRARMIADPGVLAQLRAALGPAADEYAALGDRYRQASGSHLAGRVGTNLIVIPGVMGSLLASQALGGIWWIDIRGRHRLGDLGLAPDGTGDAYRGARLYPVSLDFSYDSLLVAAMEADGIGHEQFAYDWRKPLSASTGHLADQVRAAAAGNGGDPVHLVAHSMGGLLARETLRRHPDLWDLVGQVIFLGTPHYGSPAIAGYLKNHLWGFPLMTLLGRYVTRPVFRSLWGVLSLLPAPPDVYPGARDGAEYPCANFDLYDADAYRLGLTADETAHLQHVLDGAAEFHRGLYRWHFEQLTQPQRDRMTVIAGTGQKTLFRLEYHAAFGHRWEHMSKITSVRRGSPDRDGDGRVPLASAMLEHVGDTRFVQAEHGALPTVAEVQADVFRRVRGEPLTLAQTAQGATGHLAGSGAAGYLSALPVGAVDLPDGDPGYLQLDEPAAAELDRLDHDVDVGSCPSFQRLRIL
jgi:pimeloyl-ACP methyl ester carboxylesterase